MAAAVRAQYVDSRQAEAAVYALIRRMRLPAGISAIASRARRNGSGTFRMNVALIRPAALHRATGQQAIISRPASSSRPASPIWTAPITTRAQHGWSREPVVEMLIPSTLDDTLAPAGPACREPVLPACRAAIAGRQILGRSSRGGRRSHDRDGGAIRAGLSRASVIGRQMLSPLDLERQFGLLGGDIFHGALTLNQMFSARPMLGHADYRGPLTGLVPLRRRRASRRRRHRRAGPQRRAGDPGR